MRKFPNSVMNVYSSSKDKWSAKSRLDFDNGYQLERMRSPFKQGRRKNSAIKKDVNFHQDLLESFDICSVNERNSSNREAYRVKRNTHKEKQRNLIMTKHGILKPGMVLLKHYLTHDQQIQIVRTCRAIGIGPRGFYRPSYKDGAKLRLYMMCLGLHWNPETKYMVQPTEKDIKQPGIPQEFSVLVQRAIKDANALIKKNSRVSDAEGILPDILPDTCIVNFYTKTGRLGLHQDRDESPASIRKGLPVVSFSIGDSAEFLYGDSRDMEKAEKMILESGDVLIFGGESRLVFHGITSIIPNSAPEALIKDTLLHSGRLNLTFRQY